MANKRHKLVWWAFLKAARKQSNQRKYLPQKKWAELINEELNSTTDKECTDAEFKKLLTKWVPFANAEIDGLFIAWKNKHT